MEKISKEIFKELYRPPKGSHKGQNGKLTIIGGSKLFHGASLWALKVASRIVDMVFYSTVAENEELTKKLKSEIYDFICVPRGEVEDYIKESDAVLIGPGMERKNQKPKTKNKKHILKNEKTEESNIGWETDTRGISRYLLAKFPEKKWLIDAGSLQMMEAEWLKKLKQVVITPHKGEFEKLFGVSFSEDRKLKTENSIRKTEDGEQIEQRSLLSGYPFSGIRHPSSVIRPLAKKYGCTIVLKGPTDIICSPKKCAYNTIGNEGMTKGGTGDVLAGLIAALACKNDLFLSACAGVYLNGLAGDWLYKKVGPYFNASDLCEKIPKVMKKLVYP